MRATGLRALVSALCGGLSSDAPSTEREVVGALLRFAAATGEATASVVAEAEALGARVAAFWTRRATETGHAIEPITRDALLQRCEPDALLRSLRAMHASGGPRVHAATLAWLHGDDAAADTLVTHVRG